MSVAVYNSVTKINTGIYTLSPVPYRPTPSEMDYNRGWFTRYFMRKTNDESGKIIEISKKQYDVFRKIPFYLVVGIRWNISAPIDVEVDGNAIDFNKNQIREGMLVIPNLYLTFNNVIEFHRTKGRESVGFLLPKGQKIDEETGVITSEAENTILGRIEIR